MSGEPGSGPGHRAVRSYVLRAGRTTAAQRRALETLWPTWGIEFSPGLLDLERAFGRRAPRIVEIGFGDGEVLVEMARSHPDTDYLGIEVHEPGIGHCLLLIEQFALANVRLIRHDAVEVLRQQIPDASLDGVNLFFPDPWPKKRHHKRRIVQPGFARLVASKLRPGGLFRLATDWAPYAEHVDAVMAGEAAFEQAPEATAERPRTKFQRRGERLGHEVFERAWRRSTGPRA